MYIIKRTARLVKQRGDFIFHSRVVTFIKEFLCMWGRFIFQRSFFLRFQRDSFSQDKKCIYTVLTGNYDDLQDPVMITPGWDYICITDNQQLRSNYWDIWYCDNQELLDSIRLSRKYKCLNHLVDSDYDISIYIDANIIIKGDLNYFLNISLGANDSYAVLYHPYHVSVKEELLACVQNKRDNEQHMKQQYEGFKSKGFLDEHPQVNNRLIIRRCNRNAVKQLMMAWFDAIKKGSYRDQLSFIPVLSLECTIPITYIDYWKFSAYFDKELHK
tara:strand:- start:2144 stop:2959 length:816 start_codon:yes stop_codon:yes gene_type:complete